jgi:hypothetical protein
LLDDFTVIFIGGFLSGVLRSEIVCGIPISVLLREIRCHLCFQHVVVFPLKILAITVLILLLVDVEANHEEAYAVDQDDEILKKLCDVSPYLIEFFVGC